MWILLALSAAILTGCVPLLGARPARVLGAGRTALVRAGFVLIGAGILVLTGGSALPFPNARAWAIFLTAGLADALAWLLFYHSISDDSVETAVIREKACVPLSILLTCAMALRPPEWTEWAAILLFVGGILYGTWKSGSILPFLSAACTAIQMQLSKLSIEQVSSHAVALFLRSFFSLLFLFALTQRRVRRTSCPKEPDGEASGFLASSDGSRIQLERAQTAQEGGKFAAWTSLLLILSGLCAFFAWSLTFSALEIAPAAQVQAITKLNFWITGLYWAVHTRSIHRRHWFAYAAMTVGAFVLIA